MLSIAFFIILCLAVGIYATTIDRSGIGWMAISIIITPFLASILLLIVGKKKSL